MKQYWPTIVLFLVGFLIYANTLNGEFQFDDFGYIVYNKAIHNINDIPAIWNALSHPSRFVAFFTFALNYHYHGLNVFGYHLVNVIIHCANGLLIFYFLQLFLTKLQQQNKFRRGEVKYFAFFVALLFLIHPVQTQAVSYIVQRFTSLATLFYLASLCLFLMAMKAETKKDKLRLWIRLIVTCALGMLTKPIVFTLPFMLIFIYRVCFGRIAYSKVIMLCLPLFIIPACFAFNVQNIFFKQIPSGSHVGDMITMGNYALTQFSVLLQYFKILMLPLGQVLDYDFPVVNSILNLRVLGGMGLIGILGCVAVRTYRKNFIVSFGIIWFFLTIAVSSSIIPIRHVIFEHRLYLPSIGFFIVLVALIDRSLRMPFKAWVIVILTLCLGVATYERNKVWQTQVSLWQDVIEKSPNKFRGYEHLGNIALDHHQYAAALNYYDRVHKLNPDYTMILLNYAIALKGLGQYAQALELFERIEFDFDRNPRLYFNRAVLWEQLGQTDKALADYSWAITLNDRYLAAYINRANLWAELKEYERAQIDFIQAKKINDQVKEVYIGLGNLYGKQEKYGLAIIHFSQAIAVDPAFAQSYHNRGNAYFFNNNLYEALQDYNLAIKLEPAQGLVYYHRSVVHERLGHIRKALEDALKARSLGAKLPKGYIDKLQKR